MKEKNHRTRKNDDGAGISLTINGKPYNLTLGKDLKASHTLAHTLRETLGLTGTKIACDHGGCCSCTVLMDGEPILSCMTLTVECDGKSIVTIEGLKDPKTGELNPLQQSFVESFRFSVRLLYPRHDHDRSGPPRQNPRPSEDEIQEALAGHFCRCISHYEVIGAVKDAAKGRPEPPVAPNGYRHIGKGTPRVDAEEIVSGTASIHQ